MHKLEAVGDKPISSSISDKTDGVPDNSNACVVCAAPLTGRAKALLPNARLLQCETCRSWIYLPRPTDIQQAALHDDSQYFEHPYFRQRRTAQTRNDRRCRDIFNRIREATDLKALRGERLLDIGCDTGAFLSSAARQFGIVPVGIDVSFRAIRYLTNHGIESYVTDLENAPDSLNGFALITAIDLIEHLIQPRSFLEQLFLRLRPGGLTYLETPNIRSVVYQVGSFLSTMSHGRPASIFERLFPPQHVQYFWPGSLGRLAHQIGFEIVRLDLRSLPVADIAVSMSMRFALSGLQLLDKLAHNEIIICALLRRPFRSNSDKQGGLS